jgi:hypothetical protein
VFGVKNMKKTSEEWSKLCSMLILDPDGWDRMNFDFSWYHEKITRKEFERRSLRSTVTFNNKELMWKDWIGKILCYLSIIKIWFKKVLKTK